MMWRRPNVDGNLPTPREHAALVPANSNSLLLFGGHGSGQRFNDLHYLDMESYAWQQPTIAGSGPSPRQVRKFVILFYFFTAMFVLGLLTHSPLPRPFCLYLIVIYYLYIVYYIIYYYSYHYFYHRGVWTFASPGERRPSSLLPFVYTGTAGRQKRRNALTQPTLHNPPQYQRRFYDSY
jgi:hypothetical protein